MAYVTILDGGYDNITFNTSYSCEINKNMMLTSIIFQTKSLYLMLADFSHRSVILPKKKKRTDFFS